MFRTHSYIFLDSILNAESEYSFNFDGQLLVKMLLASAFKKLNNFLYFLSNFTHFRMFFLGLGLNCNTYYVMFPYIMDLLLYIFR